MKICVCFKIVPDLDQVLSADWENVTNGLDISYVKKIYNCFDEGALEMALSLKDAFGEAAVSCTAVTVGEGLATLMKGLYAVGFDRVVRLEAEDREFCPEQIAAVLKNFIKSEGFDLVFTGMQAGMADSGMVPPMLSELLGWPVISDAVNLTVDEGALTVNTLSHDRAETIKFTGPAVIMVGDAERPYLRIPNLREKMAASKCEIESVTPILAPMAEPLTFYRDITEKNCHWIAGEQDADKATSLYRQLIEEVRT